MLAACGAPPGGAEDTASTSEAVQTCATADIEGVDVYDGTGTIDWASVKGAGIAFAMMKATQGTYNTQKTFPTNWSETQANGVYRSAYHFFDPTEDGVAQAQHYLQVVGTIGPGDLPPMLDIECPDGDPNCLYTGASGQAAASDIQTRMWDWIHTVEAATGKKPLIYTFPSYFSSNGIDTTGLDAYPLYIADITTGNCTVVPSPWTAATFWQYSWTGTVAGIGGQVDRDRFMGTLAGLGQLAQEGGPDGGAGDGGAAGDAGAAGAGGREGGASSDGGAGPEGGARADAAGTPGDAGSSIVPGSGAGSSSGCGCRLAGDGSTPGALPAVLAALALGLRRRHRSASVLAGAPVSICRRPTSARA